LLNFNYIIEWRYHIFSSIKNVTLE
jgi:hypothetical protein